MVDEILKIVNNDDTKIVKEKKVKELEIQMDMAIYNFYKLESDELRIFKK